ncbi:MAG TPA: response regulator transcription factor [Chitinophagaceae bacterium]|nr:response regulator transcription factor [Chitinophagaceae bacterium]
MDRATVMIIDDHALILDAWTMLLESEGNFEITGKIGNSAEVEGILETNHPDLVLLDINMAPVNGFEVLALIQRISPKTKVIAVSMHTQTAYVRRMIKGGARGYITKNSTAQEFLHGVGVVLKGGRYISKEVKNALAAQMMDDERSNIDKLTPREIEVISCLRDGLSSKQIATKLSLTVKTVEVHRHNILKKLNVKNSISAIELVKAFGL